MAKIVLNSQYIEYDPDGPTGLRWSSKAYKRVAGKPAGSNIGYPYFRTKIDGVLVCNHRYIYEMFIGKIPEGMFVDHIDGNPFNNRVENLRLADNAQNQWNSKPNKNKASGLPKNVVAIGNSFRAVIYKNKVAHRSGCMPTVEECVEWLEVTRHLLHGEFKRGD